MKPIRILIISLFLILISLQIVSAQKLDNYYTQRVQEGGDIYFIQPNDDFKNSDDHSNFFFDLTFREGSDSATINFTYYSKDPAPADRLFLISEALKL